MDMTKYRNKVLYLTRQSYLRYPHLINPHKLPRSRDYHIDHLFSIHAGFNARVDPTVIAHHSNLIIVPAQVNLSKSKQSSISLSDLYHSYQQAEGLPPNSCNSKGRLETLPL
jgi:hypothetical protein